MATIVLTTVGGIVGGPIGAAIGGLLGQAVDRDLLFRPAGRQGPRLTELSVQTSSYGTQLPRVFGTMRVAGCVIWSTDLIESHATSSSGKGQPSVTSYSYSASFAVALSARGVVEVRRIWADGNLLRGAGGDWKSDVGAFRLHIGDEDQPPDPLIAAAEGQAPAHRGLAYAVFEQLQLADFGNRIPSLTFELVAEADPVTVGMIAAELGGGMVDGSGADMPLIGFSAYGDSIRATLETLADACGGWWAPGDAGVALRCAGEPVATLADAGIAAGSAGEARGARRTRSLAAIESVPRTVTVTHYDPDRDYQAGLQRARRPGAGATDKRLELPAVLSADDARGVAEAALARAEAARTTRTIAVGAEAMAIVPGDVVAIDEAGSWRVTDAALEAMVVTLTLVPFSPASQSVATASSGRVLAQADAPIGRTLLVAAELPPLDGTTPDVACVTVLASGTGAGWRRAALMVSTDDGGHWTDAGVTAAPATLGTVAVAPGAGPATVFDLVATAEVTLARPDMALVSADDASLDAGANLALLGDELVQFGRAEQIGPDRWRLSRLLRGRRGTEGSIGTAQAEDRFALIEASAVTGIDLPAGRIGGAVRVMAIGVGESQSPVTAGLVLTGASTCPPSPAWLRAERVAGGVRLGWVRRSRAGWRWIDGVDAPLVEETESYRVTVGGVDQIVAAPDLLLTDAAALPGTIVSVRQQGTNGESPPATIALPPF
ncbi:phage tail protein [uncultured Sphingomonas sp.]|uniref:phage tail protein n=1 Tax=uncultured Sphingomonas sp. TaxID=158754 RepID=UPI0035CC917B